MLLYLRRLICRISIPPCLFFAWLPYSASARPGPPSYIGCSPIGDARDQREAGPGGSRRPLRLRCRLRLSQGASGRGLLVAGCRCILIARTGLRMLPLGASRSKTENPTSSQQQQNQVRRSLGLSIARSAPAAGRPWLQMCVHRSSMRHHIAGRQ